MLPSSSLDLVSILNKHNFVHPCYADAWAGQLICLMSFKSHVSSIKWMENVSVRCEMYGAEVLNAVFNGKPTTLVDFAYKYFLLLCGVGGAAIHLLLCRIFDNIYGGSCNLQARSQLPIVVAFTIILLATFGPAILAAFTHCLWLKNSRFCYWGYRRYLFVCLFDAGYLFCRYNTLLRLLLILQFKYIFRIASRGPR